MDDCTVLASWHCSTIGAVCRFHSSLSPQADPPIKQSCDAVAFFASMGDQSGWLARLTEVFGAPFDLPLQALNAQLPWQPLACGCGAALCGRGHSSTRGRGRCALRCRLPSATSLGTTTEVRRSSMSAICTRVSRVSVTRVVSASQLCKHCSTSPFQTLPFEL